MQQMKSKAEHKINSMKVICINDTGWMDIFTTTRGMRFLRVDGPAYLEICTVTAEENNAYSFEEWNPEKDTYPKDEFIPLSEIDENDFARETLPEKNHEIK